MAGSDLGGVLTRTLADGTRAFRLRFRAGGRRHTMLLHERPGCGCGCGGGWDERSARTELGNVQARIRAGVWRPHETSRRPEPVPATPEVPTFRAYAHEWLCGKLDGTLGDKALAANTTTGYRGMLTGHLLPYFGRYRLDEIDRQLCLDFKARKVREAAELREAIEAGADIRDRRNRRRVPLSASSIRKLIGLLAAILDDAVEDELIERNPARGKRMRVRVPKPDRSFLELDELAALIEAAAAQDALPPLTLDGETTRDKVARRVAAGRRPKDIAADLALSRSTVNFHLNRLGVDQRGGYVGRRAVVEILGRSGVRASELCDLRIRDVRLHDRHGARFRIRDAKTEAGVREVQMSPDLVEAVVEHLDRLRRAGLPTGPDAYLVPNRRGGRLSRQRVGKVVAEAAALATERLSARGLPPLPHTTPHSLRRTYISIALLANNFDVKWVMSQVGHADSKMTLDVYAQLEQRVQRDHGTSFDRLMRQARAQLGTESHAAPSLAAA